MLGSAESERRNDDGAGVESPTVGIQSIPTMFGCERQNCRWNVRNPENDCVGGALWALHDAYVCCCDDGGGGDAALQMEMAREETFEDPHRHQTFVSYLH